MILALHSFGILIFTVQALSDFFTGLQQKRAGLSFLRINGIRAFHSLNFSEIKFQLLGFNSSCMVFMLRYPVLHHPFDKRRQLTRSMLSCHSRGKSAD